MRKFLLFLPLFLFAEVNPFEVNISTKNQNLLTPQEKAILKNKLDIKKLSSQIEELKKHINQINFKLVRYDEVINNLNNKLQGFDTLVNEVSSIKADVDNLKSKVASLENNLSMILKIQQLQNKNIESLKESFRVLVTELKQTQITPKEAMALGKKYFFNNQLNKAKEMFLYTFSKNYLPATSAYYLGEIAFKQKNYNEALGYYKKSVELYPKKASFTPNLLLHTAISFEKLGNKEAAKLTLQKIIHDFPNSKYAKIAQKELEKLQ